VHDFVALEAQGVVTAFLASTEFVDASAAQAGALGYAAVPAIFVPHPIQDRTDAEMAALAEQAYEQVLAAVTGPAGA
jgi:hypothetical protein